MNNTLIKDAAVRIVDNLSTLNIKTADLEQEVAVLDSRMDVFTALPEGATTNDAALEDIKVGFDGTVYDGGPGAAVRAQVGDLHETKLDKPIEVTTQQLELEKTNGIWVGDDIITTYAGYYHAIVDVAGGEEYQVEAWGANQALGRLFAVFIHEEDGTLSRSFHAGSNATFADTINILDNEKTMYINGYSSRPFSATKIIKKVLTLDELLATDKTLSVEGKAADAKVVGLELAGKYDAAPITRDVDLVTDNGIWSANTNKIENYDGYTTSKVDVKEGEVYVVNAFSANESLGFYAVSIYFSDGTLSRTISPGSNNTALLNTEVIIESNETEMHLNGQTSHPISARVTKVFPLTETIQTLYDERTNPLYGKKITINGDSIAHAESFRSTIGANNNISFDNHAESGAYIVDRTLTGTSKHCICVSVDEMSDDADYVLFQGGNNDWYESVELGQITNGFNSEINTTTFYGALESICRQALDKWHSSKIGFIINHKTQYYFTSNTQGNTLGDYMQAIRDVCEKYSIPYCDVDRLSRLNSGLESYKNAYAPDGIHPNKTGYELFYAPVITNWLKQL